MLVDVGAVTTRDDAARHARSRSPLGIAPFAMQRLLDPDGEAATARAAAAAGVADVRLDADDAHARARSRPPRPTAPAGSSSTSCATGSGRSTTSHEAREAGYSALVLTVDLPVLGRRERDLRLGFQNPPPDAADLAVRDSLFEKSHGPVADLARPRVDPRRDAAAARAQGNPHARGRRRSPSSTAPTRSGSRTTAAGSSTASPAGLDALPEVAEAVAGAARCTSTAASGAAPTS